MQQGENFNRAVDSRNDTGHLLYCVTYMTIISGSQMRLGAILDLDICKEQSLYFT